jgi:tetratricopeptide (TPR) repeat protein
MLVLPPYCQAKLDGNHHPDLVARWKDMPLFVSMHHYCFSLNFLNRAQRMTGHEKLSNSSSAVNGFDYCIHNWPKDHPLMPEIYLYRGTALRLGGKDMEAMRDYYKALGLNPRLSKAYVGLTDFFADNKQNVEALKIATQGLSYLPADKALQRRYIQLGGKLPYPEPVEHSKQEAEKAAAGKVIGEEETAPGTSAMENKETAPQSEDPPKTDSTPTLVKPPPAPSEPKIGSPTNPWCRFCPPE